jgi:hypothetical protein
MQIWGINNTYSKSQNSDIPKFRIEVVDRTGIALT